MRHDLSDKELDNILGKDLYQECLVCGLLKSTVDNLVDNDKWKTCREDKEHEYELVNTS